MKSDWEKLLDERWSSINAPADNQEVKNNIKKFIESLLFVMKKEEENGRMSTEDLSKIIQDTTQAGYYIPKNWADLIACAIHKAIDGGKR